MPVKRYRIILLGVIVLIIIALIAVVYNNIDKNDYKKSTDEYKYLLKEYSGVVGIYKKDEKKPIQTINVYTYNLPPIDQQEIKAGIAVKDDEELRQIIEDFSG